ncbi:MAG: 4-hydroxy-3-methylbut-2-enyl diphosphate reductase [Bacteroidales bacterium]|nr:4-hydroxy-3-methylbut-2-enyl diphosphate reductase [Bacteroidales bacterium]
MAVRVDIDSHSGFCGGVIRAITRAENSLADGVELYSLGAIVHNESELARLQGMGLLTISHLSEADPSHPVLIRAHGEPPSTYREAEERGIRLMDCTCPVVLKLQKSIRTAFESGSKIVIFGKPGHAEVLGLVGQTEGKAVVVKDMEMLEEALSDGRVNVTVRTEVFSQTTKSPSGYAEVGARLKSVFPEGLLTVHDTICSQVASRHEQLLEFARSHSAIVFVSGRESSNGKVLCELCTSVNPRTWHVSSTEELASLPLRDGDNVGVCGATSTPKWLLVKVANMLLSTKF